MAYSDNQITTIAEALINGKTQMQAVRLAGITSTIDASKLCRSAKVQQRKAELEAEEALRQAERSKDVPEPMTIKEFQLFLQKRMLDPNNKDAVRYAEMFGKSIKAFTERIEVEGTISLAEILTQRMNRNREAKAE